MTSIPTGDIIEREDERCFVYYDVIAEEAKPRCVDKGEGYQEVGLEDGPIFMDDFGTKLECRKMSDEEERECFRRHGVDIDNRLTSPR